MPFQYRCDTCKTTSPSVATRAALAEERKRHRDLVHGGHVPDEEREIVTGRDQTSWVVGRIAIALLVCWLVVVWISHL